MTIIVQLEVFKPEQNVSGHSANSHLMRTLEDWIKWGQVEQSIMCESEPWFHFGIHIQMKIKYGANVHRFTQWSKQVQKFKGTVNAIRAKPYGEILDRHFVHGDSVLSV
ncbi:hypothetical protein TNCT_717781 [Trichonephila clavata]|uniref:Uncharacterized protein n=1 Tax=Trichonephila clavata TaxID=2740835 RepID=A0A8X6F8B7_TRICU|nr:hypothetical protein TNCT_717781 [Trichonephila clavata]